MDSGISASVRGVLCVVTLMGLAACNGEDRPSSSIPTAHTPDAVDGGAIPNEPAPPSTPSHPSNPTPPQNPTEPVDPTEPTPAGNAAPQISGAPAAEITVGQAFSFQPSASDADGDTLSFSIQSKPSWASFNPSTGRLWGTPGASDVGSHEQILISVNDGEASRALPEFAINVLQQANGSATLAWQPPTANTDGSPLTNLKGYKIHYGTQPGTYDQTITLNNAGLTRYVIENLAPGTYYFAISTLTTNGLESDLSGEANTAI